MSYKSKLYLIGITQLLIVNVLVVDCLYVDKS